MQINIACCDDERTQIDRLKEYFNTLSVQIDTDIRVDYYLSGELLLQKVRNDKEYFDIYVLDVEMPEINGIKLGEEIRNIAGRDVLLIYLTNYPEYMHDSFQVQAFQYMTKSVDYEPFKAEIVRAIKYLKNDDKSVIFSNTDSEEVVYRLKSILYIEKVKGFNTMQVVHSKGDEMVRGNINTYEGRLLPEGFVRVSRAALVNMGHIHRINDSELVLDNDMKVKVSIRKLPQIKSSFAKFVTSGMV